MYNALGIHWASSIPAFLALACVPAPFLFYKYGEAIRVKCKYAAESAEFMKMMKAQSDEREREESEAEEEISNRRQAEAEKKGEAQRKRTEAEAEKEKETSN
jgi:hypothetical protein